MRALLNKDGVRFYLRYKELLVEYETNATLYHIQYISRYVRTSNLSRCRRFTPPYRPHLPQSRAPPLDLSLPVIEQRSRAHDQIERPQAGVERGGAVGVGGGNFQKQETKIMDIFSSQEDLPICIYIHHLETELAAYTNKLFFGSIIIFSQPMKEKKISDT